MCTKKALLQAAEVLFTRKGYAAVSTREIAEEAKVNLASIQYHFGSKSKLFIETIDYMMSSSTCASSLTEENFQAENREQALAKLAVVIEILLKYFLIPKEKHACRLMLREIFSETAEDPEMSEALITTFAEKFSKPLENWICLLLKEIKSDLSDKELKQYARSIFAQCVFYTSHHPFLKKIDKVDFSTNPILEDTIQHVTEFSLRALGCSEVEIKKNLSGALSNG
ncbi:MAG: TetR/AcrR family transcriptional regulator [Proteobacteria bacterium]|nr:TetR/AcrR family transcriptional regulator [Pseudomonadota bacterium]